MQDTQSSAHLLWPGGVVSCRRVAWAGWAQPLDVLQPIKGHIAMGESVSAQICCGSGMTHCTVAA